MPRIDIECQACEEVSEVFRPLAMYPATPPCPKCDSPITAQVHLPQAARTLPPAVVIFKAPDGTFRFPGDSEGASTDKYERMGYERIEARGWAEVRSLESRVGKHEASKIRLAAERRQEFMEEGERRRRSEVFNGMRNGFQVPEVDRDGRRTGRMTTVRMSEAGKAIMQTVIDRANNRKFVAPSDAGFRVEAYSENRSNRDESRGSDGRRRRD